MTHKMVGMYLEYDNQKGLLTFTAKNRLKSGINVEIINPECEFHLNISEIINSKSEKVDTAHGGAGRYSVPCTSDPGEFAVMCRPLYPQEVKGF